MGVTDEGMPQPHRQLCANVETFVFPLDQIGGCHSGPIPFFVWVDGTESAQGHVSTPTCPCCGALSLEGMRFRYRQQSMRVEPRYYQCNFCRAQFLAADADTLQFDFELLGIPASITASHDMLGGRVRVLAYYAQSQVR